MQCPACGTVNPTSARFCMGCGLKLIVGKVCDRCQTVLPSTAQYCYHCGAFAGESGALVAVMDERTSPLAVEPTLAPDAPIPIKSSAEVSSTGIPVVTPPPPTIAPVEKQTPVVMPDFALSPLVGHEEVFASLLECSDALLHKRGQIVSLMGNSGLGKSRLKRALQAHFDAQPKAKRVLWVEGHALSCSEQMSYRLLAQVIRQALALPINENMTKVGAELQAWCALFLGEEAADTEALLRLVLGMPQTESNAWVMELTPQVRHKRVVEALTLLFTTLARKQPLVISLGDLHWADEASLIALKTLIGLSDQYPILWLLIFRARRDKGCWQLRNHILVNYPQRYSELKLEALSNEESAALLKQWLPGATFKKGILTTILEKVAGNPFSVEEAVRSLIENQVVQPDAKHEGQWIIVKNKAANFEMPDTLHKAIEARIARLSPEEQSVLQTAAVMGRHFSSEILQTVVDKDVAASLSALVRDGLIQMNNTLPEADYAFPSVLVQEVAYDALEETERKALHRTVGMTLLSHFKNAADVYYDWLAYHFNRSDDMVQAIQYLEIAVEKAYAQHARKTAIQYYRDLLVIWEQLDDRAGQAQALQQMGIIAYEMSDYREAKPWLVRAMELYEEIADKAGMAEAVLHVGRVDLKLTNYEQAIQHHALGVPLTESLGDKKLAGQHLLQAAQVMLRMGAYNRALQLCERAIKVKQKVKDGAGQAYAYYCIGLIHIYQETWDHAETAFKQAMDLWLSLPNNEEWLGYAQHGFGLLALRREAFEQAESYFHHSLTTSKAQVQDILVIENLSHLALACVGLGRTDAALDVSLKAITMVDSHKDVEEIQRIYWNHYLVLAARKDVTAFDYLKKAYDAMEAQAERITDASEKQTFLEQVWSNRQIQMEISRIQAGSDG